MAKYLAKLFSKYGGIIEMIVAAIFCTNKLFFKNLINSYG